MAGAPTARVRALYKRLLRLHRRLPSDLRVLGDQYVKDEFRRHKVAGASEAARFMEQWQAYADVLQTQVLESAMHPMQKVQYGASLTTNELQDFNEAQVGQLYELMQEATKPNYQFNIENDPHHKK
ncbi:succinate dehydrogenase assembly factor 3, mitochondrial [Pristis pectinata]|uniref:succinate dehydrogenase assembly factor 3, mitochondrial n=1 Tax=Pristis pectinata TaxID=685728 RepID=UPI00223CBCA6|nr:succinate dehydrogenase assembly factor 3, mitochondrial [Pristis pectinata]